MKSIKFMSAKEYRDSKINTISPSFCAAKWYNATIWLGHGSTASCHHPPAHQIDLEEIKHNPSAIHNTKIKKQVRQLMLDGTRPNECDYCWRIEDLGDDFISDRVHKTQIYEDADVAALQHLDTSSDVMLKTLEVSFDRVCNFA